MGISWSCHGSRTRRLPLPQGQSLNQSQSCVACDHNSCLLRIPNISIQFVFCRLLTPYTVKWDIFMIQGEFSQKNLKNSRSQIPQVVSLHYFQMTYSSLYENFGYFPLLILEYSGEEVNLVNLVNYRCKYIYFVKFLCMNNISVIEHYFYE